ncbi:MAG: peptidylprolyl isomerase [Pseudomonadota bacterium]
MTLIRTFVSALCLALASPVVAQDYTAETVLARVGDKEITLGHVALMVSQLPDQYRQLPDEALLDGIVDQLIDQELLAAELEAAGEVPGTVALTLENERRALMARATVEEMMGAALDEADVQARYDETIGAAPAEIEYNASHILVETEEEADTILADLEAGADFAEMAQEKSTGPSGPNGGLLGWFGAGAMVPAFDAAVQEMEVGALAGPVETQFGWHVILLNETRETAKPTLDESRAGIEQTLRGEALEAHLEGLRGENALEDLRADVPAAAIRDLSIFE